MSMYDVLHFPCPKCNKWVEVQSKAGPCTGQEFAIQNAPLSVIADVEEAGDRGEVVCKKCRTKLQLAVQRLVHVVEYEPSEDEDD